MVPTPSPSHATPESRPATAFGAYVGIDWSGARGPGYRGVAVAQCLPGDAAPTLVPAPGPRWTRGAVLDWLLRQDRLTPLLVGLDLAFALPEPFSPAPDLWAEVDRACVGDDDLLGLRYASGDSRFWHSGPMPQGWQAARRPTELACRHAGLGHPETPLKLVGARQVGRGALAGMRLLHRLRQSAPQCWQVWPFDGPPTPGRSVCVEIYPRLFILRSLGLHAKLREPASLDLALQRLGSRPGAPARFDDHEADALVSAAGLRHQAAALDTDLAGIDRRRGWIFGVPVPQRGGTGHPAGIVQAGTL